MDWLCAKCGKKLEIRNVTFRYLSYEVTEPLPCCPECGQVYLDEALVRGRMHEVETEMEDK